MTPMARRTAPAGRAGRRSRLISAAVALLLAANLGASTPVAFADTLEDQQAALDAEAARVQQSLEFVDAKIAKAAGDLVVYQGQLPGAQQALLDAQGRVAGAVKEVEALAARVDLAQQNKAKITQQLENDKQKTTETKKLIGQIATQAYKSGGVPSNLSLFFGSNQGGSLTDTIDLADQALRSQNSAMDKLTQQNATNVNSQARLQAVEAEIKDLKAKADAALAREKAARDEAEAKRPRWTSSSPTPRASTGNCRRPSRGSEPARAGQGPAGRRRRGNRRARPEAARGVGSRAAAHCGGGRCGRPRAGQAERPYVPAPPGPLSAFGLRSPFNGIPITSGFGWRATPPGTIDFYGQGGYMHTGIDFGAPAAPRLCPGGRYRLLGGLGNDGGGNHVKISHGVVQGNSLTTIFYHNTSVVVSAGQQVSQGQLIAYSGTTGNSTGCHSHFETWVNGRAVDPMGLL